MTRRLHGPDGPVGGAGASHDDVAARRVESSLRTLPTPAPDPVFRARLEQDFVAGRIGRSPALALGRPWFARPLVRFALGPIALVLLASLVVQANRGAPWTVVSGGGVGFVSVDGRAVPAGHLEEIARLVRPGARVRVDPGTRLELESAGTLAVELTAGAEFVVPRIPGRWFGRRTRGEVRDGEIRVTTGRGFRGAMLAVDTPEAVIEVTGTTLAVICEPTGTCVCVHAGVVRVGARGAEMVDVPEGRRRYIFNDGRAPELAEIRPTEHVELNAFEARHHGGARDAAH